MKNTVIILLAILNYSCQNLNSFEGLTMCSIDDVNLNYTNEVAFENFALSINNDWEYQIEETSNSILYKFQTITDTVNTEFYSDQDLDKIHNNFSTLVIVESDKGSNFNYKLELHNMYETIKKNKMLRNVRNGKSTYKGMPIDWFKYDDESHLKDGITSKQIVVPIISKNKFLILIGQIAGKDMIDERTCEMIEIYRTLKLNA